jgi:hypothetical protein
MGLQLPAVWSYMCLEFEIFADEKIETERCGCLSIGETLRLHLESGGSHQSCSPENICVGNKRNIDALQSAEQTMKTDKRTTKISPTDLRRLNF